MATPEAEVARLVRVRRIVDIATLEARIGERSRRSLFRDLKKLGYLSSFTHAGRYYTLPDIPQFDADGLWFHEKVGFSRLGTLKETVSHLVPEAPAGRTHGELRALLRVRVQNTLHDLHHRRAIGRRVVEGLHELVYVSPDPTAADRQMARREQSLQAAAAPLPSAQTVIAILGEALRAERMRVSPQEVSRRLSARGMPVGPEQVERVLAHYDLLGVKKNDTPPSTRSPP
jgi:hypothetical protein